MALALPLPRRRQRRPHPPSPSPSLAPSAPLPPARASRHQLALYFNLTGIKWDYTAEQALEGFISPTNGQPPRVLRINPRGLSSVQIADMLWAEVGEAYRLS